MVVLNMFKAKCQVISGNRTKTLDKPLSGVHLYRVVKKEATLVFPGKPIHPHSFKSYFLGQTAVVGLCWHFQDLCGKLGRHWVPNEKFLIKDSRRAVSFPP